MRITTLIVRLLVGAFLLFASITYFFPIMETPKPEGEMATVFAGFMAMKYLMPLAKVVELLSGLSYVTGKFIKLFNLILLPVSLNILLINIFPSQDALPIALFIFLGNIFLIYANWNSYKHLIKA